MSKHLTAALLVCFAVCSAYGQSSIGEVRSAVNDYFSLYTCDIDLTGLKVNRVDIDQRNKLVTINLNDIFAYQLFRKETVDSIYAKVSECLPEDVRDYTITITSHDRKIEDLIPNSMRTPIDQNLLWNSTAYTGNPWVSNISKPYRIKKGLSNIHLSITPSHGYYYERDDTVWKWQRPALFCTREDLLTQSFVYPYLMPMLENAGAVVYSSRERDWQTKSVIVDNTSRRANYQEESGSIRRWETRSTAGYSTDSARICKEVQNASVRIINSNLDKNTGNASAMWIPDIPEDGEYAVYVTYQSYYNSIPDARYIVFHSGGVTMFHVNQQIGGGTWVYLGTFKFNKGRGASSMVALDNSSTSQGIVCADAVRFGGGIGNEERNVGISGKPRYLEGARYYTRFAGAPDSVYLKYDGKDDYKEDIQTRPRMTNWLSGGSVFNQNNQGIKVPLELSFALHTDAGYRYGDSIVGTLGIYTTDHNEGRLGSGLSRDVSRDLSDIILDGLKNDIEFYTGRTWTERGLWDKNYCESREPQVPSMILELLSHQNFYDLKLAFDPTFRFLVSRSIYKSILKYVNFMHGRQYAVQPLPVNHFMIKENQNSGALHLSWQPKTDPQEPTAMPESYVIYTAIDNEDFDNGLHITHPYYDFHPLKGHIYRFKVTAINSGGESFPSEILSAYVAEKSKGFILIANGFNRLSGPATLETDSTIGFDIIADPGVSYIKSPILCGIQQNFNKYCIGIEDKDNPSLSLGHSDDRFDGMVLGGNNFDYPHIHGQAIASANEYSFVSCSRESLEDGDVNLNDYMFIDLILGLQKRSDSDTIFNSNYSTFSEKIQCRLTEYLYDGGRLLSSGSYIGSDMLHYPEDKAFTNNVLKYECNGVMSNDENYNVVGEKLNLSIRFNADADHYGVPHPDIINPTDDATSLLTFKKYNKSAAVAYSNNIYRCITLGFPFESITDEHDRKKAMRLFIKYLTE